ncbi:PfkB family carbohydrate kinase [Streptomyces sp. E11-3]|uniref:PfkB family carbohydrate kinase n=1 Tax=Streptomyces sp. E11-3 TaxID=3110112 RepID=UPI00397F52CE
MSGSSRVTVVGEVLVDLLWRYGARQVEPVPGGSPANVAVGLHRLGRQATLVTAWGDDAPGAMVQAHLEGQGLDVRRTASASGRTTIALAHLDAEGSASYDFLAAWDPTDLVVPDDTAVLHTGSLAVVVEPGASQVLRLCRALHGAPGRAVVADLNVRPQVQPDRDAYRAACLRLAGVTDVVKASDEDLGWLFPDLEPVAAARLLLAAGPRLVVVTLGGDGALAVTADTEVRVGAPEVAVADTVGAGDAFQAALLDALAAHAAGSADVPFPLPLSPEGLVAVLTRCAAAAALNCTRVGADPPSGAELDAVCRIGAAPPPSGPGAG